MSRPAPAPFYPWVSAYVALLLLLVVTGFYPSYFSRLAQTDVSHHAHGITATLWVLLLCVQSWLFKQRRMAWHRTLGRLSLLLVPIFVASGVVMMLRMATDKGGFTVAFGARLAFVDFTALLYFCAAYGLALLHRRRLQLHSRYMISTALLVMPPALARVLINFVPGVSSFSTAFHGGYLIAELMVLGLIAHDWRRGQVHAPFPILLAVLALQHASFLFIPHWPAWQALVHQLAS